MASLSFEGAFGACLLMVGPPDILTCVGPPVSSQEYMLSCAGWYNLTHVQSTGCLTRYDTSFLYWWKHYKNWLVKHGHRGTQDGAEA